MLNPDAEKDMKSAVDDMIEYFLVRVSDRHKQILVESLCKLMNGVLSIANKPLVCDAEQVREYNNELVKYWNTKASERGLQKHWIRFRRMTVENRSEEEQQ